ncbi:hypothetical protein [Streptomyces flaveolus]|uniref:hypothetical protein n=1 Tax=Streptomyces flaveolus TaxID=67297 RepID=UPI0036FA8312
MQRSESQHFILSFRSASSCLASSRSRRVFVFEIHTPSLTVTGSASPSTVIRSAWDDWPLAFSLDPLGEGGQATLEGCGRLPCGLAVIGGRCPGRTLDGLHTQLGQPLLLLFRQLRPETRPPPEPPAEVIAID